MKICVVNQKGGVGKSTTVVNLGACLAELGKKVLIVDCDPQGNATSGVGIAKKDRENTTYDLILNDDIEPKETIVSTKYDNLFIIPSNIELAGAEVELVSALSREKLLSKELYKIDDIFDYIIIDCQPSLGLLTINSLVATDNILIPVQCEYYALEGLGQLMETIQMVQQKLNPALGIDGLVITMYDSRCNLSSQVTSEVRDFFGDKVYRTIIPRNIRLSEAPSHGKTIVDYDPDCAGAIAYRDLAKEFLGLLDSDEEAS
ncbi:MAG: ParA family protein [archaeon]